MTSEGFPRGGIHVGLKGRIVADTRKSFRGTREGGPWSASLVDAPFCFTKTLFLFLIAVYLRRRFLPWVFVTGRGPVLLFVGAVFPTVFLTGRGPVFVLVGVVFSRVFSTGRGPVLVLSGTGLCSSKTCFGISVTEAVIPVTLVGLDPCCRVVFIFLEVFALLLIGQRDLLRRCGCHAPLFVEVLFRLHASLNITKIV